MHELLLPPPTSTVNTKQPGGRTSGGGVDGEGTWRKVGGEGKATFRAWELALGWIRLQRLGLLFRSTPPWNCHTLVLDVQTPDWCRGIEVNKIQGLIAPPLTTDFSPLTDKPAQGQAKQIHMGMAPCNPNPQATRQIVDNKIVGTPESHLTILLSTSSPATPSNRVISRLFFFLSNKVPPYNHHNQSIPVATITATPRKTHIRQFATPRSRRYLTLTAHQVLNL